MITRLRIVSVAVLASFSLVACASVVDGTPVTGGAGTFPTTTVGVASFIEHGLGSVTSAHLDLREQVGSQAITASGDETIADGKAKDLSLTERIPNLGTLKLIIVGSDTFVQLPPSQRTSDKPWTKLTASTSDPELKALYEALASSREVGSLDSTALFVRAARGLHFQGTENRGGVTVGHYSLAVEVDKLPSDFPQKSALEQAGLHSIPLQLWVDTDGRTREFTEHISVAGQTVNTDATLGSFNASVHISAPPADQVSDS